MYHVEIVKYQFRYRRYRLPFRAPVRTAHGLWREREGLLLRLEDESGRVGWGEAAPVPHFGAETVDAGEAACTTLGPDPDDGALDAIPRALGALRNAVAAAREAAGPAVGKDYLGVAALLPAGRAALGQIEPRAEIGFRVFKWKVGVGDPADELAILDDICAQLPNGAKLRLDANGAWDRRRAERWLERCAERPVEFIEQPIAADARGSFDLLMGLAGDFPTPLALDESLVGDGDVEQWLGAGWPGVFVIKPCLMGDLKTTLASLEKARAAVVFSSALETAVGARRALRAALAWTGEARSLGFGVWPLFADGRFDGPAVAPFVRREDVDRIDPEAVWNALN
jgi:o-succinylbenzoate synthase